MCVRTHVSGCVLSCCIRNDCTGKFSHSAPFFQRQGNMFAPCCTLKEHLFCSDSEQKISQAWGKQSSRTGVVGGKNPFLSQKGYLLSPLSLSNFYHHFSLTSLTTFHPLILFLLLLCFTSSRTPDRLRPLSIIVILLPSSFHAWPSSHHILLSYLSSLEWCRRKTCRVRRWQETVLDRDVWLVRLLSGNKKSSTKGVLTPQGCAVSAGGMTGGWGGVVEEERGHEGV